MQQTLKRSIYIKLSPVDITPLTHSYPKQTEQISKDTEEHQKFIINQTINKKSIHQHHHYNNFVRQIQFPQKYVPFSITNGKDQQQQDTDVRHKKGRLVQRMCLNRIVDQYKEFVPTKIDTKWKEKRNKLATNRVLKRTQRIDSFKEQLKKRIEQQIEANSQSDIHIQTAQDIQERQQKINQFVLRQQYLYRQKEIIRQMQQFSLYGSIKPNRKQ